MSWWRENRSNLLWILGITVGVLALMIWLPNFMMKRAFKETLSDER